MEGTCDRRGGGLVTEESRRLARRAGLLYGLASSCAPFAYLYVPGVLLVKGDALATADRVRVTEGLLRAAIVGELCSATLLVFAALALYELFKRVDPKTSTLMAVLMLVSVPISYVNALIHVVPLLLIKNTAIASVLNPGQVAAQVMLFLRLHTFGLVINQIFWGLWLFPIGALVMRSGFIPRWLGYPLFFAGAGYMLNSLGTLLLPPSLRWITENLQALGVGEMPFFSFYLLIWGVRGHAVDRLAALLVLTSFAIGTGALVLLLLHRIDAIQYAALALVSLLAVFGLVMRWRSEARRSTTGTVAAGAPPPQGRVGAS
jgi:uncharacterized protein DUF4386